MWKILALILFVYAETWANPILVVPGIHPNYDQVLPADLTNNSGFTLPQLSQWAPQYDFAFSDLKVAYLSPDRPWELPIWTVRAPTLPPESEIRLIYRPHPDGPIDVPIEPPIDTPDDHPDDQPAGVPEPGTMLLVACGIGVMWRAHSRKGRQ